MASSLLNMTQLALIGIKLTVALGIKRVLARMKEPKGSSLAVQMCLQLNILITSEVGMRAQSVKILPSKAMSAP